VSGCVQKKKARDGIARKRRVSPSPRPAPRNVPGEYTVHQHGADDDVLSVPPRHPQPKKSKPPATVSVRTEEAGAAAAAKSSRKKGVEDRRSGRRNDQQPAEAEADNVKKDVKISSSLRKKYAMKAKAAPVATEESELMASLDAAFPDSPVQAEGSRRAQKKSGVTTSSPSPGRKSETKGSKSELKQSIDDAIPDWLKDTPVPEKALPKKSHAAASRTNMSQDKPRAAKKKKPIAPSESTDVGASKPVKSSSRSELKQSIDDAIPDWLKDTPVPEKALPKKSSAANASPSPNKAKPSPKPKPSPHKSPSPKKNVGVAVDSSHEDNFDYADNDFEAADDEDKHWEAVTTSKPVKSSSRSELKQSIDDAIPDWLKDTPVPEKVSPKKSNAANASPSPNKAKPSPKKHVGIAAEPEEIPVEATVPEEDGLDAYYSNSDDQQASADASPLRSVVGRAGTPPSQSKASQKSRQEGAEDYGADEDFEPLEDDEEERLMGGAVSATGAAAEKSSKPVKSSSRSELKQSIDDAIPDWLKDSPMPEKVSPKKSSAANASPSPNKAKPSPKKHVDIAAEPEEIPVEATVPAEDGLDAYYSNSDDQQASAGASPLRSVVGRAGTPPSQSKASQKSSQEGVEDYGADEDFEPLEDDEEERLMGGAVSATGTAAEKSSKPVSPPLRPVSPPVSRGASFVRKGTKSASPPPSSDAMGVSDSSFPVYEPQRSLGSVGNDQITTPRVAEEEDEEVYAEEDFESSASAKILGEPASEGAAIVKENQRVASPPIRAGAALEEEEDGDVDYAYEEEQYDEEFEGSADSMGSAGKKAGDGNLTSASIAQSSGKTAVLNVLYGDDEDNDGGGGGAMNEEEDDDMEYEPYGDENDDYEFD
jgi:hypothetical protein